MPSAWVTTPSLDSTRRVLMTATQKGQQTAPLRMAGTRGVTDTTISLPVPARRTHHASMTACANYGDAIAQADDYHVAFFRGFRPGYDDAAESVIAI